MPRVHKGFVFSTVLPTLVVSCLFYDTLSKRCDVIFLCGFDYITLMANDLEHVFLLSIFMFNLENICSDPLPTFKSDYPHATELYEYLCILDSNTSPDIGFSNIFLFGRLPFHVCISFAVQIFSLLSTHLFFTTSGVWINISVKFEIGSRNWRTRRDQNRRQSTPDGQVVLITKGTYLPGWYSGHQVKYICTCPPVS